MKTEESIRLIQEARRATRLSQEGLARLLGIHRSRISKWERGVAMPTAPTRKLLQLILADPGGTVAHLETFIQADG
jgi:DNA-binding transcriptional regulator YiaG